MMATKSKPGRKPATPHRKRNGELDMRGRAPGSAETQFKPGNKYAWKPGQSGNPAGTKGPKMSDLLTEMLGQPMPADEKQAMIDLIQSEATIGQIIAFAAGLRAAKGDLEALSVISDRTEGAPDQTIKTVPITADDMAAAREKALAYEREKLGAPSESPANGQ